MSENNKSYRIRTNVGSEYNGEIRLNVNLLQDYDELEVLSLKIGTENLYKYHTANYGCIVGRVLANGGVGVPNVKISSFIPVEDIDTTDPIFSFLYPYSDTRDKNRDNIRYNLLTDAQIDNCHQAIGTFPNKRLVLDDNNVIEVYDKYYKFTTTTNGSGDYMLFGLPVGNNIIHSDLDLSDIGILSQKPRDLFYKGYTAKQFENASQFKKDTNLDNLTQVISQDSSVYVFPFWGDETENEGQIKIVRNDIDVNYKFEPTCIFIGCIVSDEKSNAISKNCIPHERMGKMDRLTTGAGTIEMIRKTISGDIESFTIQGNELIDGNGTWCYQIPMNLDYMATDEYGVLVPTDDYNKGIPTRASVRFRVSLADYESDYENAHLVKVLVPNNPKVVDKAIDYDYEFGSATKNDSFRDMFWNNVYTVKSYIPRFQKGNRQRNKNFTGFKAVNVNGANNPIPYNNMRINFTFLFVFQCLIFKSLVLIVKTLNKIIYVVNRLNCGVNNCCGVNFACGGDDGLVYLTLDGGMCPSLDGNYIAPGAMNYNEHDIIEHTYKNVYGEFYDVKFDIRTNGREVEYDNPPDGKFIVPNKTALPYDKKSSDIKNSDIKSNDGTISHEYESEDIEGEDQSAIQRETRKIYNQEDYFVKCVELQFAMEYEVIQFDFYNDWINGMIYIPRWFAEIRKNKDYAYYCGDKFRYNRYLTQQCAIGYNNDGMMPAASEIFPFGCRSEKQQCHKRFGRKNVQIFGLNRGIVVAQKNSRQQYAYYLRPSEIVKRKKDNLHVKVNLFPTDIVLLGSVTDYNQYGIPKVNGYTSSTYRIPPPTAELVSDTQEMNFDSYNAKKVAAQNMVDYINQEISFRLNAIFQKNFPKNVQGTDTFVDYNSRMNDDERVYFSGCTKGADTPKYDSALCFYNMIKSGTQDEINIENEPYVKLEDTKYWVVTSNNCSSLTINLIEAAHTNCMNIANKVFRYNKGRETDEDQKTDKLAILTALTYEFRNLVGEQETDLSKELINICSDILDETVVTTRFFGFDKKLASDSQLPINTDDQSEGVVSEISGIDWGYNPFTVDNNGVINDDTTSIAKQIAGHFLEIGCTFSLSNAKSCVNLQRVCELGSELSQSHYYKYKDTSGYTTGFYSPSGIISKREIADEDIRTTFATLNSKNLGVVYDSSNGYKKYSFLPYVPVSFMGDLSGRSEVVSLKGNDYGLIENQSLSYRAFRFGIDTPTEISKRFLYKDFVKNSDLYFVPVYENSFYFYFGLRDGNTAIDRLYSEYYAPCSTNIEEAYVTFTVVGFDFHYNTKNMAKIKSVSIKLNGVELKLNEDYTWDKKKCIITVHSEGKYIVRLKDTNNKIVKSIVVCEKNKSILFKKVLTEVNTWFLSVKAVNCSLTEIIIDGTIDAPIERDGEWYKVTNEFTPDTTHTFSIYDYAELILYKEITFNENVEITNKSCRNDLCTIKYSVSNMTLDSIECESASEIDYTNQTFAVPYNSYNVVKFKNKNESVIINRAVDTIEQPEDPEDDYWVDFNLQRSYDDSRRLNITAKITPEDFVINKIFINEEKIQFEKDADNKCYFNTYNLGVTEIVFENVNGHQVTRHINTNVNITIPNTNITYNDRLCTIKYQPVGFTVAAISCDRLYNENGVSMGGYDHGNPKPAIKSVDLEHNTVVTYNGYNGQKQPENIVSFQSDYTTYSSLSISVKIDKKIQMNPPFQPWPYPIN